MGKSWKKNPFCSIVAGRSGQSEKKDKQSWHRAWRRKVRVLLKLGKEDFPTKDDIVNQWCMSKDGKVWMDVKKNWKYLRK